MLRVAELRHDLLDYFGTARTTNPVATIDLIQVENADINGLIQIAEEVGFDLENYVDEYDCD